MTSHRKPRAFLSDASYTAVRAAIPLHTPERLPDGLHVAPFLSWDGAPELLIIRRGELIAPPLRISVESPHTLDPTDYSPALLAAYHRPWTRGLYRMPCTVQQSLEQYIAVDAAGRRIDATCSLLNAPFEGRALDGLRRTLMEQDPITRPRPRGEKRF